MIQDLKNGVEQATRPAASSSSLMWQQKNTTQSIHSLLSKLLFQISDPQLSSVGSVLMLLRGLKKLDQGLGERVSLFKRIKK